MSDQAPKENFPLEIWGEIISFTPKEVKTIRAINKELKGNISQHLKINKDRVYEFKRVTNSVLEFIEKETTRVRITDDDNLEEEDFKHFKNLEFLSLSSPDGSSLGLTDDALLNLVNLKHLEIIGDWPNFDGTTLDQLPSLESLTLDLDRKYTKIECDWSNLRLKQLKCSEDYVSYTDICKIRTLEVLHVVATKEKSIDDRYLLTTECRKISDLYVAGFASLWFEPLVVFMKNNGKNIRKFGFGLNQRSLNGARQAVDPEILTKFSLVFNKLLEYMPNVQKIDCEVTEDVDLDFSKCVRLDQLYMSGIASNETIQSIPSGCEVVVFKVDVLHVSDMLKIGNARLIDMTCYSKPHGEWSSEWGKKTNKSKILQQCKKMGLRGLAGGYGYELIAKSGGLEELTVDGIGPQFLGDSEDTTKWKWPNALEYSKELKKLDVLAVAFDSSALKKLKRLEDFKFVTTKTMLYRQQTVFGNRSTYPKLSQIFSSRRLISLDLTIFAETEIDFDVERSNQDENLDEFLDLGEDEIESSTQRFKRLKLGDLGLAYVAIIPQCVNLTTLELFSNMGVVNWIKDNMFDRLSMLERIYLYNVSGVTGDFLGKTPRVESLSITNCPTFSVEKLKKYARDLPLLVEIMLKSTDGVFLSEYYKGDYENAEEDIDSRFPGTNIKVWIESP